MTIELSTLNSGLRVRGLVAGSDVIIVAVEAHGDGIVNVVYRKQDGTVGDRLITAAQVASLEVPSERRWTFLNRVTCVDVSPIAG